MSLVSLFSWRDSNVLCLAGYYYPGQKTWDSDARQTTGVHAQQITRLRPLARGCPNFFGQGITCLFWQYWGLCWGFQKKVFRSQAKIAPSNHTALNSPCEHVNMHTRLYTHYCSGSPPGNGDTQRSSRCRLLCVASVCDNRLIQSRGLAFCFSHRGLALCFSHRDLALCFSRRDQIDFSFNLTLCVCASLSESILRLDRSSVCRWQVALRLPETSSRSQCYSTSTFGELL